MKKTFACGLALLLLAGLFACGAPEAEPEKVPFAVFTAMKVEAKQLINRMDDVRAVKVEGVTYWRGRIGEAEVVVGQFGMGLKKAQAGAEALIRNFQPDTLFVYGTCGAIVPELEIHETLIADAFCLKGGSDADTIPADEALASLAQELLPHARRVRLVAEGGFSWTPKAMERIADASGAVAIDLESYAVAKAARAAGVPLLAIRCTANTWHYSTLPAWPKNGPVAADMAARATETVIRKLTNPEQAKPRVTVAALTAMEMEAKHLIDRMEAPLPMKVAGKAFTRGQIGNIEIVLHQCGMGLDKAEAGARALMENFQPDVLILFGMSGGIAPGVELYETVIADAVFPAWKDDWTAIPTDEALAALAAQALPDARRAAIATGNKMTWRKSDYDRISQACGAVAVDQESWAVAKAAQELGVPLLIIRSMSDTYDNSSLLGFFKYGPISAEKAAADAETVIRKLAEMD